VRWLKSSAREISSRRYALRSRRRHGDHAGHAHDRLFIPPASTLKNPCLPSSTMRVVSRRRWHWQRSMPALLAAISCVRQIHARPFDRIAVRVDHRRRDSAQVARPAWFLRPRGGSEAAGVCKEPSSKAPKSEPIRARVEQHFRVYRRHASKNSPHSRSHRPFAARVDQVTPAEMRSSAVQIRAFWTPGQLRLPS